MSMSLTWYKVEGHVKCHELPRKFIWCKIHGIIHEVMWSTWYNIGIHVGHVIYVL